MEQFIGAALVSWLRTGAVRRYTLSSELLDLPNERSLHRIPTPRGGGGAVALVTLAGLNAAALCEGGPGRSRVGPRRWRRAGRRGRFAGRPPQRERVHSRAGARHRRRLGGLLALGWTHPGRRRGSGLDRVGHQSLQLHGRHRRPRRCGGGCGRDHCRNAAPDGRAARPRDGRVPSGGGGGGVSWVELVARANLPGGRRLGLPGVHVRDAGADLGPLGAVPLELWLLVLGVFVFDATVTLLRRVVHGERWYQAHCSHAYQRLVQAGSTHAEATNGVLLVNLGLGVLAWLAQSGRLPVAVPCSGIVVLTVLYLAIERRRPMFPDASVPALPRLERRRPRFPDASGPTRPRPVPGGNAMPVLGRRAGSG